MLALWILFVVAISTAESPQDPYKARLRLGAAYSA